MERFNTERLYSGNNLIIGSGRIKECLVNELLRSYKPEFGALIVFDYDARLYESYEGASLLADFASKEGVAPNMFETLLRSKKYGAEIKSFISMMHRINAETKPTRNANDSFWISMAEEVFRTYVEYMSVIYLAEKYMRRNGNSEEKRDDIALFAKHAGKMKSLMYKLTACDDNRKNLGEKDFADDPQYKIIARYVEKEYGRGTRPFAGTLRNHGSSISATFASVYMSTFTHYAPFFKFMDLLEERGKSISALPALNLSEFAARPSSPLFICGTGVSEADQAFGAFALISAAVAAQETGSPVTLVIPELERWNLADALAYLKGERFGDLSTVVSFTDASNLASKAGRDKYSLLTDLADTSESLLWLHSADDDYKRIFECRSTAKERVYKLNELGDNFAAYHSRGSELQYCLLPEQSEQCRQRSRRPFDCTASTLWKDRFDKNEMNYLITGLSSPEHFDDTDECNEDEEINEFLLNEILISDCEEEAVPERKRLERERRRRQRH